MNQDAALVSPDFVLQLDFSVFVGNETSTLWSPTAAARPRSPPQEKSSDSDRREGHDAAGESGWSFESKAERSDSSPVAPLVLSGPRGGRILGGGRRGSNSSLDTLTLDSSHGGVDPFF